MKKRLLSIASLVFAMPVQAGILDAFFKKSSSAVVQTARGRGVFKLVEDADFGLTIAERLMTLQKLSKATVESCLARLERLLKSK